MKEYLESNGINVVDAEVIQYGDKEWSVKKPDATGDIMPVLVDFAHGKPMFVIHTDHHDTQAGVEQGTATNFRPSRSNVETISQVISPRDIFPNDDIHLISIVDSANFAVNEITPEMVMNYLFTYDRNTDLKRNKTLMGLVCNKLLLAYKNKPRFLEELVLHSKPSLLSILNNIKKQIGDKGFKQPEELTMNKKNYIEQMKTSPNVRYEDNIIVQYGGGSMFKPGSYDRYTPFKNNPDADFLVIAWPMGLVQASCNPFKKERALKGVNLGEVKDEVLGKWENSLKQKKVSLYTIKRVSEITTTEESVGFTFKDFEALYGSSFEELRDGDKILDDIRIAMEKKFSDLTYKEKEILNYISVSAWDIIQSNSGGHKCITNISGLIYLGRETKNDQSKEAPYVTFTKMVQNEFVRVLKSKMND